MDIPDAQAQTMSILDLPGSLGVNVDDIISFSEEGATHEDTGAGHTGAGILLVAKICDAVLHWGGYGDEDAQKVANLVARNLITCEASHVEGEHQISSDEHSNSGDMEREVPGKTVASMLKKLLDPTVPHPRHVHINSNEPVLLINFEQNFHPKDRNHVNDVVDATVEQLQQQWNVWPVRVYGHVGALTRRELEGAGNAAKYGDMRDGRFSMTLLNVVNTEIGGPSMPQLLDASCDAPEWRRYVRREVWRGRDLVSREEGEGSWSQQDDVAAAEADNASERSFRSENGDDDDQSVGSDELSLAIPKSPEQPESLGREDEATEAHEQGDLENGAHRESQHSAHLEESFESGIDDGDNDREAASATTQSEPPSQDVKHPTWERHDDSTSLIDLIRSQALMLAPFGIEDAGHGVGDIEGELTKSRSERVGSPSPEEDEFVVV
ncbi:hypothetical protein AYL99_00773 [Fonsecaea erecta]|uniref:DhaK domain-containing protein n=1 Tax=Fonsecaea erecta TaxID=1367422 RepID=A0A178ZZN6_9EURO|nr:hypothetical protein AYL99_00773 [Fonsecaea erecta]OAP64801.1 hypothetical protein AYL99_00773 [Fonsecaea erecta]